MNTNVVFPSRSAVRLALLVPVALIFAAEASAVPRYSARYEQKCALCHTNPSGGGQRNLYASQYLVPEEMAWSKPKPEILEGIDPMIAKNIIIGTDFRMIHTASDDDASGRNFFQMQGDIYVNFQMDEQLSLYYDQGITTSYELFGLWQGLPLTGYVKAGRFVPAYGWRYDDHTMFVREELGFLPPANSDVGVEFGLSPGRSDIQFAVVNGNRGSTADNDDNLAAVFSGAYRGNIGGIGWAAGLAGYWRDGDTETFGEAGTFGYLTWRRLAWVAELDYFREDPDDSGHTTGLVTSHELSFRARQGLEFLATYDFYDPDWNSRTGAKSRWGGGASALPRPFLAVQALYRVTSYDNGALLSGSDSWETVLQIHLLY
ncbi:MAG TPA: hypothetical protein VFT13_03120 [Candidatus Krumholzibacteria bacterium]|nr:hypothetical protein [Candidatus Krumholzibacteria bacterium]